MMFSLKMIIEIGLMFIELSLVLLRQPSRTIVAILRLNFPLKRGYNNGCKKYPGISKTSYYDYKH